MWLKDNGKAADASRNMVEHVEQLVHAAVYEAFGTMLNLRLEQMPEIGAAAAADIQVASSVGFIGKASGVVFLCTSDAFARKATRKLLALEHHDFISDEMVNDAMGELTNIIAGRFKSRLTDRGYSCALTIPSIMRGRDFAIEPTRGTNRYVTHYSSGSDHVLIETLIRTSEGGLVASQALVNETENSNS